MTFIERCKEWIRDFAAIEDANEPQRDSSHIGTQIEDFHRLWEITESPIIPLFHVDTLDRWDAQATHSFEQVFGPQSEARINEVMQLIDSKMIPAEGGYRRTLKFFEKYFFLTEESKKAYSRLTFKTRALLIRNCSNISCYEIESLLLIMSMCESEIEDCDLINDIIYDDCDSDLLSTIAECNRLNYEALSSGAQTLPGDHQEYRLYEPAFLFLRNWYDSTVVDEFFARMLDEQVPITAFKALDIILDWDHYKAFPLKWSNEVADLPHSKIFGASVR